MQGPSVLSESQRRRRPNRTVPPQYGQASGQPSVVRTRPRRTYQRMGQHDLVPVGLGRSRSANDHQKTNRTFRSTDKRFLRQYNVVFQLRSWFVSVAHQLAVECHNDEHRVVVLQQCHVSILIYEIQIHFHFFILFAFPQQTKQCESFHWLTLTTAGLQ